MEFYGNFIFCTFLMIFIGALSLALAEGSPVYVTLTFTLLSFAWLRSRAARPELMSKRFAYWLSMFTFLFMFFDWAVISQALPVAFAHFLLLIQIIKVHSPKEDRDYIQIYTISFIHLALSSIMTIDLSFALTFILYMIAASWALTLFHLKRGAETFYVNGGSRAEAVSLSTWRAGFGKGQVNFAARAFYAASCASTLLTLIFTVFLFSIFPRIGTSFFKLKYRGNADVASGFSDQVEFGSIGRIKLDNTPVLTFKYIDRPEANDEIYLRGLTYNTYDGKQWTSKYNTTVRCPNDNFGFRTPDEERKFTYPDVTQFTYRISQGVVQSQVIFHVAPATSIAYNGDRPDRVYFNPVDETYLMSTQPRGELRYIGKSLDYAPDHDAIGAAPSLIRDEKLHALFTEFTGMTDAERAAVTDFAAGTFAEYEAVDDFSRAQALESKLKTKFRYTLEQNPTPGVEPVYDFLFNIKSGHCEYFASAFVVLCRSAGMPARLVGGYRGGDLNDMGDFYQITQTNAHAWAEVYFDGFGWVRFDPTPPDLNPQENLLRSLRQYVDYLRYSWDEFVIDFSLREQIYLWTFVRQKFQEIKQTLEEIPIYFNRLIETLAWVVRSYGVLLLLSAPAWIWLALRIKRMLRLVEFKYLLRTRARTTQKLIEFFVELLMALEYHGFRKEDHETAREFADRVIEAGGVAFTPVLTVVMKYYDTRFGSAAISSEDLTLIRGILEEMRSLTPDYKQRRAKA